MGERREVPEFGRGEAADRIMKMKVSALLEALQERFLTHFVGACADEWSVVDSLSRLLIHPRSTCSNMFSCAIVYNRFCRPDRNSVRC
jgi:3-methyladenine DNA glycosylase AlkD